MMTVTMTNGDTIMSCEFSSFTEIDDMLDNIFLIMEGMGWHRSTIESAIIAKANEIQEQDNDRAADPD
jgi:hypothetical protein